VSATSMATSSPTGLLIGSRSRRRTGRIGPRRGRMRQSRLIGVEEDTMGKTGRKRRARKKKGANHGKRPNA
jgi:hypothetical protein